MDHIRHHSFDTIGRTVGLIERWFAIRLLRSFVALAEPIALELNYCSKIEFSDIKSKWKCMYTLRKVKNADLLSKCQCCDDVNRDLEHFTAEADKWLGLGKP